MSEHKELSYRYLARKFHVSVGTVAAIARAYKLRRKPEPKPWTKRKMSIFPRTEATVERVLRTQEKPKVPGNG